MSHFSYIQDLPTHIASLDRAVGNTLQTIATCTELTARQVHDAINDLTVYSHDRYSKNEALFLVARLLGYPSIIAFHRAFSHNRYPRHTAPQIDALVCKLLNPEATNWATPLNHGFIQGLYVRRCLRALLEQGNGWQVIKTTDLTRLECSTETELRAYLDELSVVSSRFINQAVKRLKRLNRLYLDNQVALDHLARHLGYPNWPAAKVSKVNEVLLNLNYVVK